MVSKHLFRKFRFESNTGFGASASAQGSRLVNRDGTFNIKRRGLSFGARVNIYHELINMTWGKFTLMVVLTYTFINFSFAMTFLGVGIEEIEGARGLTLKDQFWDAFFFSSQTLTTVGYGRTSPIGFHANLVAAIECLIGLMLFAIITGLLYGRFSKPRAKLIYSRNALIAPYKDGLNALMFRVANGRRNQLIECEAQVLMSYIEPESNIRRFIGLDLEFKQVTSLALSWTIVHPINAESPLSQISQSELEEVNAEFMFIFKAFDDTYSQTVHTRYSYLASDLVWGAKFKPMFHRAENSEATTLELNFINAYEEMPLFAQTQIPSSNNS